MKYLTTALITITLFSCKNNTTETTQQLINADKKWCERASQIGFSRSRVEYADSNQLTLLDGDMPLIGIKEAEKFAASHPDTSFSITWKPVRAELATSGDMGYTFGGWTVKTKKKDGTDTTFYGDYLTVWKKQADGSWKYVADGGNSTPKKVE